MKSRIILLLFVFSSWGFLYAKADVDKHIFSLDLDYALTGVMNNGWGLGVYYDRAIFPALTLKGGFGHMTLLDRDWDFEYTVVSISLALSYYPFGETFRKGYCGVANSCDFMNYVGSEGREDRSVISFLPYAGWKFSLTERIILDLFTGYKFAPVEGELFSDEARYLNMGMQYKANVKFFLNRR